MRLYAFVLYKSYVNLYFEVSSDDFIITKSLASQLSHFYCLPLPPFPRTHIHKSKKKSTTTTFKETNKHTPFSRPSYNNCYRGWNKESGKSNNVGGHKFCTCSGLCLKLLQLLSCVNWGTAIIFLYFFLFADWIFKNIPAHD